MTPSSGGAGPAAVSLEDLGGSSKRRQKERFIRAAFLTCAALSILISILIVLSVLGEALTFLTRVDLTSLWTTGWFPRRGLFDIKTIVAGTLLVTGIGMLVAVPLGLGAAMYLSEYARPKVRRLVKPILEILAGIPSVVLGYFALTWISPTIVNRLWPESTSFNMAASGIAVGILVTPLIASVAEDAMRAVPTAVREASYGLGARKRTVTTRIVFPAAISGIVAALIIGASRAIGETMIVAIASGATGGSLFSLDPTKPGQTMTAAMTALATGSDQVKGTDGTFESLFFVGLLLFLMTLVLNLVSQRFVRRVRQKY
ncbi:MAG: phosphate ABC transporter permease subunit PstC [Actinomycetota bacterium]